MNHFPYQNIDLWVSVWFNSLLTNQELNRSATMVLMSYYLYDKMTSQIQRIMEFDFEMEIDHVYSEHSYCAGSMVAFPSTSHSVLCYCGRIFRRRWNNRQETWKIPKHIHTRKENSNGQETGLDAVVG